MVVFSALPVHGLANLTLDVIASFVSHLQMPNAVANLK